MKTREIEIVSYFLSSLDSEGSRCVSFNTVSSYVRRIDLRYQYHHLLDFKAIYLEINRILENRQEFERKWKKVCKKELIGIAEMRVLLHFFGVDEDVTDLILLKFVEQETSTVLFFNRIESFYQMNRFLEQPKRIEISQLQHIGNALIETGPAEDKLDRLIAAANASESRPPSLNGDLEPSPEDEDCIAALVRFIQNNESEKATEKCLDICKNFDVENTGRISLADFVNILSYNLETGKSDQLESLLLRLEKEFVIGKNMNSIEYTEIFDKIELRQPLDNLSDQLSQNRSHDFSERNLTEIIEAICSKLENSNFDIHKSFYFFDKENTGLITR